MNKIRLLPDEVASQVAAGEVVERPASVIKELVENSLDAGAGRVEVLIRGGGASLIRVTDDGSGMSRDDALLSLERHATSKIRTGADLAAISTLGFRGEALPSIASVSRFRMQTREHGALEGTDLQVNGGKIEHVRGGGEAPGTQLEVRSLFYNLPARRKFLRSENTETGHVEHQMRLLAIGHPEVAFVLLQNDRTVFQLPPTRDLLQRIRDLYGKELAGLLLPVGGSSNEVSLSIRGFVGKAGVSRPTRSQQLIFVNGRPVENLAISQGLREGYHTALMKGQHAVTFLFIDMDPAAVDVNVHPAKREVRFHDPRLVRDIVAAAVREALEADRAAWSRQLGQPSEATGPAKTLEPEFEPRVMGTPRPMITTPMEETSQPCLIPTQEQVTLRRDWASPGFEPAQAIPVGAPDPSSVEISAPPPIPETRPVPDSDRFQIIGVLGKLYVLMENADGLVMIDQHAAHERILFEEFRRRLENQTVLSQRLLLPSVFDLPPRDSRWVVDNLDLLERAGIFIEVFGESSFKLDSLPVFVKVGDPATFLASVIHELQAAGTGTSRVRLGQDVIAATVCRHAVKANDRLRDQELVGLVEDLLKCELPYCCPHGRPTMIQISYDELEKKFGRKTG